MDKLEELENKYKELGEEIEKLKNEKKTGKWIPEKGEEYWFIDDCGEPEYTYWNNDEADKYEINFLKIFKTKEEAEEYLEFIKAKKECSYEFTQEEWGNDNIEKHCYLYDYEDKEIRMNSACIYKDEGQTYFKTEEDMKKFIKKYEKQILKYDFGIENV